MQIFLQSTQNLGVRMRHKNRVDGMADTNATYPLVAGPRHRPLARIADKSEPVDHGDANICVIVHQFEYAAGFFKGYPLADQACRIESTRGDHFKQGRKAGSG